MKPTDDELIAQMRSELDQLVADVPAAPATRPPAVIGSPVPEPSGRRGLAIGIAAASVALLVGGLIVVADRGADEGTSDTSPPPPTVAPITTVATPQPSVTAPPTVPETAPPTTADVATSQYVVPPPPTQYAAMGTVLETPATGPQLCIGWIEAGSPPFCNGPDLSGWSWDAIEGEQTTGGATWVAASLTGTWDAQTQTFDVTSVRPATDAVQAAWNAGQPRPDYSLPCPESPGESSSPHQSWPEDAIAGIDGYAGAWPDASHQVMTVKFTGDLAAAEQAVRQYYDGPVCVVSATHSAAELAEIQGQLQAMSSIQWLSVDLIADATGEWVQASTMIPDPDRQAAFDTQYGTGVVRIVPVLRPV